MSRREAVEQALRDICADMGLPGLGFDDGGLLSLSFDDMRVTFALREAPLEHLAVYVDLGPAPVSTLATAALLELNLQGWMTQCMTLGLDPRGERALGWNTIAAFQAEPAILRGLLEAMLRAALEIRPLLARLEAEGAARPAARPDPRIADLKRARAAPWN